MNWNFSYVARCAFATIALFFAAFSAATAIRHVGVVTSQDLRHVANGIDQLGTCPNAVRAPNIKCQDASRAAYLSLHALVNAYNKSVESKETVDSIISGSDVTFDVVIVALQHISTGKIPVCDSIYSGITKNDDDVADYVMPIVTCNGGGGGAGGGGGGGGDVIANTNLISDLYGHCVRQFRFERKKYEFGVPTFELEKDPVFRLFESSNSTALSDVVSRFAMDLYSLLLLGPCIV